MKKIFTLLMLVLAATHVCATDYSGRLSVSINGVVTKQDAVISVDKTSDGKYNLSLKNFVLSADGNDMGVGNIELNGIESVTYGDITVLKTVQNITITAGDLEGIDTWLGPLLGEVPIDLTAELCCDNLYTAINIDMSSSLGQVIYVTFGKRGFQIENSDFENFHTASVTNPSNTSETRTSDEPDAWHSFMSASNEGLLPLFAWMATNSPHTFTSDVTRPGTTGEKSVLVTSTKVLGVVANGTITTGRINAGSTKASDTSNHSYSDMSVTDTDANGDPFYSIINGRPDSLAVWVKFIQGTPNANYPYATVKAVITDGTYYQDPEDKEYGNVIAKAVDATIESNSGEWQRLSIPFEYTDNANTLSPKVIHVTMSTNASPGQGSLDSLYIDDMALIYNCGVSEVTINGTPVSGFTADKYDYDVQNSDAAITEASISFTPTGAGTITTQTVETGDTRTTVTITAMSNDLLETKTYVINIDKPNGITTVADTAARITAIYTPEGIKVNEMLPGNIYVVKYFDGKIVKVLHK